MVVNNLAQETIDRIREAEEKAKAVIDAAYKEAEKTIADSRELSDSQYNEAISAAQRAADITLDASRDENSKLLTDEASKSAKDCAKLKKDIEPKLDDAISAVIAEIIGGKEG